MRLSICSSSFDEPTEEVVSGGVGELSISGEASGWELGGVSSRIDQFQGDDVGAE